MADVTTQKPAYLISSLRRLEPGRLGAFRQAAASLTAKAGGRNGRDRSGERRAGFP